MNAAEDGRNGSTLYFADEPIGNQRSILRSALYILEERISLGCSLLFPGKPSSPRFMADDLGPCVFPTIQTNDPEFGQMVNTYNTTTENQANILLLM